MKIKIIIATSIVVAVVLLAISLFLAFTSQKQSQIAREKTLQGQEIVSTTDNDKIPEQDIYAFLQKSVPTSSNGQPIGFGINNVDYSHVGWIIVTCTFDNSQDGDTKLVISKSSDANKTLTLVYNPYTMSNTVRTQLPKAIQDTLGDDS